MYVCILGGGGGGWCLMKNLCMLILCLLVFNFSTKCTCLGAHLRKGALWPHYYYLLLLLILSPKPSKDHLEAGNFRPIALTSCLCKRMERMINDGCIWSLESQGLLLEKQCCFRKNHSMLDHLICFEMFIRNTFVNKECVLTILFDLENSFNTTWKHSILVDLWDLQFRGYLPIIYSELPAWTLFQC